METLVSILHHFGNLSFHKGVATPLKEGVRRGCGGGSELSRPGHMQLLETPAVLSDLSGGVEREGGERGEERSERPEFPYHAREARMVLEGGGVFPTSVIRESLNQRHI